MNANEYIKRLQDLKRRAEKRFDNLGQFESKLLDISFNFLVDKMGLKMGFSIPETLPEIMDDFVTTLVNYSVKSRLYTSPLNMFLVDLEEIRKNAVEFHKTENKLNISKAINPVQKAVTQEVINQYTENGLNRHFVAPLRDVMFNNIVAGMNQMEAREYLREYIKGGKDQSGKLKSYLNNTAMQGVDSYSGAINVKIAKDFTFTGYTISGSIIKTSSKQCIYAIETSESGYLDFETWEQVLKMARENPRARLIEGTTISNLPINKLHWGCRHEFTPTIKN